MSDLFRLSARAAVDLLRKGEVSPLEMVDAAAARIEATDGALNALPTPCIERVFGTAGQLPIEPRPNTTAVPQGGSL